MKPGWSFSVEPGPVGVRSLEVLRERLSEVYIVGTLHEECEEHRDPLSLCFSCAHSESEHGRECKICGCPEFVCPECRNTGVTRCTTCGGDSLADGSSCIDCDQGFGRRFRLSMLEVIRVLEKRSYVGDGEELIVAVAREAVKQVIS